MRFVIVHASHLAQQHTPTSAAAQEKEAAAVADHVRHVHARWFVCLPEAAAVCPDADILQAYQDQNTTVAPGLRGIKHPAAIAPVWLEKPERIAALAMLTVLG